MCVIVYPIKRYDTEEEAVKLCIVWVVHVDERIPPLVACFIENETRRVLTQKWNTDTNRSMLPLAVEHNILKIDLFVKYLALDKTVSGGSGKAARMLMRSPTEVNYLPLYIGCLGN